MQSVHGIALQTADLNGLLVVAVQHAGALAQHLHRAGSGTAQAKNVGVKNCLRGAFEIVVRDLLDEARHVDMRGAGLRTRRVEAKQAAVGFSERGRTIKWRMKVREARRNLRRAGCLLQKR